jgi:hypothetical protein
MTMMRLVLPLNKANTPMGIHPMRRMFQVRSFFRFEVNLVGPPGLEPGTNGL